MNVIKIPVGQLLRPEKNVRIHTEHQLQEFERSIQMFGQIRPIVVDETNTILAGVGCYETLCRLGYTEADVYKIEGMTDNQKKKLMMADNKLFGLGIDDIETFNVFLDELQGDLDIPGYDEDILRSMVADSEEVSEKLSEYGTLDQDDIDRINAAGERKESMIAKAEHSSAVNSASTPQAFEPQPREEAYSYTPTEDGTLVSVEVRKSIICPQCGEEIWL